MEFQRVKNKATRIAMPVVDSTAPEGYKSSASLTLTAYYSDNGGAFASLSLGTPSEIGTLGIYELALTAAQMNHDVIMIKVTGIDVVADVHFIYTGLSTVKFPTVTK